MCVVWPVGSVSCMMMLDGKMNFLPKRKVQFFQVCFIFNLSLTIKLLLWSLSNFSVQNFLKNISLTCMCELL